MMKENKVVILPKKIAEALDYYLRDASSKTDALSSIKADGTDGRESQIILEYFDENEDELLEVIVKGYSSQTPEERLSDYYDSLIRDAKREGSSDSIIGELAGITMALTLLGIKIEGVNA